MSALKNFNKGIMVVNMSILSEIYSVIKNNKSYSFKIDGTHEDNTSKLISFLVRLEGKCTPPIKKDPISLLKEGRAHNYFSEEDFNTILDALLENQKRLIESKYRKKLTLIKHQFSEQLNEPLVVYNDINNHQINIKPAKEIYSNIEMLRQFNSEDSACIGYIIGCHETENEYKFRNKDKPNNVLKFDSSA